MFLGRQSPRMRLDLDLVWTGLVWTWTGLDWTGLQWIRLDNETATAMDRCFRVARAPALLLSA